MNTRSFYSYSLSFLMGIGLGSVYACLEYVLWLFLGLCITALAYAHYRKISSYALLCIGMLLCLCIGLLRAQQTKESFHPLDSDVGSKMSLQGVVCDEPVAKGTSQTVCFKPDTTSDKIIVSTSPYPSYEYGDRVLVDGKLAVPKNFTAYDGGPEFNYIAYLAKDNIRYTMFRPHIRNVGGNQVSLQRILFRIKRLFTTKAEELFPEPESSLLGGILVGDKQGLSKETTLQFKNAGLIHVLVLSGYNVTIVAESFMKLFSFLPRVMGHAFGFISIGVFALMTGASSTTVRASVMGCIALGGRLGSRRYDVSRALVSAGVCMVMVHPPILVFDTSFQLSFLSTVALIYVSPLVSDKLDFITERWNLRDMVATTIATQIFTTPFVIFIMGQVSIISLVSNIAIGPIIPYAMLYGFITLVLGFLSNLIALPGAWVTALMLSYVLHVTAFFGDLSFASIHIHTSGTALVCIYGVYVLALIYGWRQKNSSQLSPS